MFLAVATLGNGKNDSFYAVATLENGKNNKVKAVAGLETGKNDLGFVFAVSELEKTNSFTLIAAQNCFF